MSFTTVDWIALGIIAVAALGGLRRGLVVSALSLGGLAGGAYGGSRIAPHVLHGGAGSVWTPLVGLVGAVVGALLLQTVAGFAGSFVRGGLKLTPLRLFDSLGGLALGAVTGLVFVWVLGATALLVPGRPDLRRAAQRSEIIRRLNDAVPPRRLFHLLARIDPFPSIIGPSAPGLPPSPAFARAPAIRHAAGSVVRVVGTACGVGVEGTGWFATPRMVVTAAHVVAGQHDTRVEIPRVRGSRRATVVAFDPHNDVAVLRVTGALGHPLALVEPQEGAPVAIVGYPHNGPLSLTPGRMGRTVDVLTQDAYGHGPIERLISALSGRVRHGNSGGPAIDRKGAVESTIFAAKVGGSSGFGVPGSLVLRALRSAQGPVSTGSCAG